MVKRDDIPFYSNSEEGTHCLQASLQMVLGVFEKKVPSLEELEVISKKEPGKWTWPTVSFLWLLKRGYEVKLIEEFDYEEFGKRGKDYLLARFGPGVTAHQEKNSTIDREKEWALEFAKKKTLEYRVPEFEDIEKFLKEDYVVICNVNACCLYQQDGYTSHFVVPISLNSTHIGLHDPGYPPKPNQRFTRAVFEKAWGFPTLREKELVAIKKK